MEKQIEPAGAEILLLCVSMSKLATKKNVWTDVKNFPNFFMTQTCACVMELLVLIWRYVAKASNVKLFLLIAQTM